jgi:sugar phosphate isomerase/epimerase
VPGMKLAVDLITFYHPKFWGVGTAEEVNALAESDPRAFWDKMLGAVRDTGVSGVECTFGPFSYETAFKAYGSLGGFKAAMDDFGLTLVSGFMSGFDRLGDLEDAAVRAEICASASRYAEVIAAFGGDAIVAGPPMRKTKSEEPIAFVDMQYALPVARLFNEIGAAVARHGVKLALHTEAHSVMCTSRDVDLFMLLTDPLYVGFCPDSAHLVLCGADPAQLVARHHDRLVISHWKDATGPMPLDVPIDASIHDRHRPYFCNLGAGRVDWHGWARAHRDAQFDGWMILEVDATPDPVATVREGRQFVQTGLSQYWR